MKKIFLISTLLLVLICVTTSCSHEHQWSECPSSKGVTCTQDGINIRVCDDCGESQSIPVSATGHTWSAWNTTKENTCTQDGLKERTCSCGEKETQTISASGHTFSTWNTTKEATCTVNGTKERSCACGEKEIDTIVAYGHTWSAWNTTKEATCTVNGSKERSCSCGEKETRTISASGHTFSTWNTTQEATCTVNGSKERSCACGEKETDTIVASHAWKDATCTEAKSCSKCGLSDGAALGHTCSIGTCERCSTTVHPTVNLPSTPMTVWCHSYCSMRITELSYKFDSYGSLIISFSGEKTYGKYGDLIGFSCKVLDADGYILYTGQWLGSEYNTGDKFRNKTLSVSPSDLNGTSEYTIVITDYN